MWSIFFFGFYTLVKKHLYIVCRCIIVTINLTDSKSPRRPRPMLAFPFSYFLSVCDQTVRSGLDPVKSQDKINLSSPRLLLLGVLVMTMRSKPCTVRTDVSGDAGLGCGHVWRVIEYWKAYPWEKEGKGCQETSPLCKAIVSSAPTTKLAKVYLAYRCPRSRFPIIEMRIPARVSKRL